MGKGVWGIDVSKSSIKVVRLEGGTLTNSGVFPYETAGTGEAGDLDEQIKTTLAQIKQTFKIAGEPVVFSLPSHSTFNRLIKLPPVEESKVPEIVKYEAQSQIPFNIEEVIWDYQYVEREYAPGEEKEVILFAIKRDIVEQFIANIADLGFNAEAIQFAPVALFNFLLKDQEITGATVALDMGGDNTDLIVIDGNKFWVRNLPITGNDITKALQKAFNIPFEEAEKLKLKAGQSQQAQKIFNAIQPILRDLANEINRSMGYYKSISKTSKFEQIILLGNATKTLNFQKFISQSLQLPAVRIQKLNTIEVGGTVDPGELGENLATIGTAIGLALQAVERTANRVNLLPAVYRQKKELRKKQPWVIAAAAALYVLAGLAWYKQDGELKTIRATLQKGIGVLNDVKTAKEELEEAKKVADVESHLKPLADLTFERDLILKVMDRINPNIPINNDPKLKDEDRLWVVDWKFEEKERMRPGEAPPPTTPGHSAAAPAGKLFPKAKAVVATLEVCIEKPSGVGEGRDSIVRTLLNWKSGRMVDAKKPCVLKNEHWELTEGGGFHGSWSVEPDNSGSDLKWPVPSGYNGPPPGEEGSVTYSRYKITLEIYVGVDTRKAAVVPAPVEKK